MAWNFHNIHFHVAMYGAWLGVRPNVVPLSGDAYSPNADLPRQLRIHFWTPARTAGAIFIVDNMLPCLREETAQLGLQWNITHGERLPEDAVDWLICFKATPPPGAAPGQPRKVMLICDQAEVHWKDLPSFDEVVSTSSEPFSWVVAWRHRKVFYIAEAEPERHLAFGEENLKRPIAEREPVLLWHGGPHSLPALQALRPALEDWAARRDATLHVICGREAEREERWGNLTVRWFPWSEEQVRRSAAVSRLGIVPAKRRLKLSWLKPASRVRCLYAQGVPAIGDGRTPDVVDFARRFGSPVACGPREWGRQLERLWDDTDELQRLAEAGHAEVRNRFTTRIAARKWIRYFAWPR